MQLGELQGEEMSEETDSKTIIAKSVHAEPPMFAMVNGKVTHMVGDNRKEAEDLMKLSFWMCGKKQPRIQWPD